MSETSKARSNILHRLFVFGTDELASRPGKQFAHWISITNPGASNPRLPGFAGKTLHLQFGDVFSEADARRCQKRPPCLTDIREGIGFFREAWVLKESKILISCDYGASRSPGLAYVCIADQLGDEVFDRRGALTQPLKEFYTKLNQEILLIGRSKPILPP
jgi:predicted protein tyrosine phosphatase